MQSHRVIVAVAVLVACGGIAVAAPMAAQPQGTGSWIVNGIAVAEPITVPVTGTGIGTVHTTTLGQPITFQLTGTGTGTVGATPFTQAIFTLSLTTNTSQITEVSSGVYATPQTTATINISGIGLATFTATADVFSNTNTAIAGFTVLGPHDVCDMSDAAFASYQLTTAIGPISSASLFPVNQFNNVPTNLGNVTFTSYHDGIFTAQVGGEPIPTASATGLTILLVLLVACGIVALRRLT